MLNRMFALRLSARGARAELVLSLFVGLLAWGLSAVRLMGDYFLEGRGAVKGVWKKMVGESLVMCIDSIVNVVGAGLIVGRSVLKTEEQVSRLLLNLAEMRTFYNAGFLSGSRSSAEPVVFSRATHNGVNHGERRGGVKGILFSQYSIWSGERRESK